MAAKRVSRKRGRKPPLHIVSTFGGKTGSKGALSGKGGKKGHKKY